MRWPEDARVTPDIRSKLDARLAKFLTDDPGLDGAADSEAVQDLILDLYAIYTTDAGSNAVELRQFMLILGGIEWDTDEPRHVHSQKYINRLFSNRTDEAYTYLDKAISDREAEDARVAKDAFVQAGASGGEAKNKDSNAAVAKALDYYKKNHAEFKNKKEAAWYCAEHFPPIKYSTYYRLLRKA